MLAAIIAALSDSLLRFLAGLVKTEMDKRGLVEQGRLLQHEEDLTATAKEAQDAAQIREQVQSMSDTVLDDDLNRLRDASKPSGGH